MKSCPTCNRTFEDTLTYCLIDGSILSAPFDPQATQKFSTPDNLAPTAPSPKSPLTPTLTQALPPDYGIRQRDAVAGQPVRNTGRRLWPLAVLILLGGIVIITIVIASFNRNTKSANSTTLSNRDSKQVGSNTNESIRPSSITTSQDVVTNNRPSPTPSPTLTPQTAVKVKLRMFTEGSGGDYPNEEEVSLHVGGQTFKKTSNSSGYVTFENVPCGNEITITHEGFKGPNQVIVKRILACDKPVVDFGMFNQFGKFTNKSYIVK